MAARGRGLSKSDGRARTRFSDALVDLSDALATLAAERSISSVLQRIADLAHEVVGARYAALGVWPHTRDRQRQAGRPLKSG
jgi:hypothetical protein